MQFSRLRVRTHNSLNESYRTTNWAVLGFVLYCLALPFFLLRYRHLLPGPFMTCASLQIFGRPCALCGLTRGLAALARGDLQAACALNILVIPVALLLVIELVYRAIALVVGRRREIPELLIRLDLWAHLVLMGFFLGYSVVFMFGW